MLQGGAIYAKMHSYGIDVRTRQMAFGTGRVAWCSQCYKVRRFYMDKKHRYSAGMLAAALIVGIGIGFCGGYLGGVNHDLSGNYNAVWMLSIALSIFGVLVHFWVNEEQIVHD